MKSLSRSISLKYIVLVEIKVATTEVYMHSVILQICQISRYIVLQKQYLNRRSNNFNVFEALIIAPLILNQKNMTSVSSTVFCLQKNNNVTKSFYHVFNQGN